MQLGLFSMPLHPPERPVADTYDDDVRTFQLAEELGYEEVWIGEHFTSPWENIPAPDLFIARLAAETKRLRFGTGVVLMPFHNPLHVALRLAQLDQQTRGRLMVGFGSGGLTADKRAFGIDPTPEQAGKLTFEGIDVVLKLWAGEPCSHDGEFFRYQVPEPEPVTGNGRLMRTYQQPHPPVAFAGVQPRSYGLGLSGERGWIPMSTNFLPPNVLTGHWESYAEGAARAGRTADRALWRVAREIHVAESGERARAEARDGAMGRAFGDYMLPLVSANRGPTIFKDDPGMPDQDVTIDYLIDRVWIVGSPDECAAKLRALRDQTGGFGYLLQIAHDWAPYQDRFNRSMELLSEKVLPAVASS
jgi:alkanesulfonate monooxygenase SsuD/methylene tetrahydromethanopterin reductase-like flavin-dependent oxidoreductase (luciferase family)